jgi:hypothetical protein
MARMAIGDYAISLLNACERDHEVEAWRLLGAGRLE